MRRIFVYFLTTLAISATWSTSLASAGVPEQRLEVASKNERSYSDSSAHNEETKKDGGYRRSASLTRSIQARRSFSGGGMGAMIGTLARSNGRTIERPLSAHASQENAPLQLQQ